MAGFWDWLGDAAGTFGEELLETGGDLLSLLLTQEGEEHFGLSTPTLPAGPTTRNDLPSTNGASGSWPAPHGTDFGNPAMRRGACIAHPVSMPDGSVKMVRYRRKRRMVETDQWVPCKARRSMNFLNSKAADRATRRLEGLAKRVKKIKGLRRFWGAASGASPFGKKKKRCR